MPLTEVSNAIFDYLQPSNSNIANLGTLYQALPKVANEEDLFVNTPPGTGVGATIWMFFTGQVESRKALGGQHNGRKMREYELGLLILFKSDLPTVLAGQLLYYQLIDDLTAYIQADRNAGTEAANLGGSGPYVGTGYVWQWGEGTNLGGPDIRIDHFLPRTEKGGVVIFQSVAHVTVIEFLNT